MFSANLKPTAAGRALLAKCQAGATMHFTRVKIGSGTLGETDADTLTDVIAEEASCQILSVSRTGSDTYIKFLFKNDNAAPFYLRECALMAEDPDSGEIVAMYANDGDNAELISAAGSGVLERVVTLIVTISSVETVTATISSAVFASKDELDKHLADQIAHVTEAERKAWNAKVAADESGKIPSNLVDAYTKEETVSEAVRKAYGLSASATPTDAFLAVVKTVESMMAGGAKIAYGYYYGGDGTSYGENSAVKIAPGFKPLALFVGNTGFFSANEYYGSAPAFMICWRGNNRALPMTVPLPPTEMEHPWIHTASSGRDTEEIVIWGDDSVSFYAQTYEDTVMHRNYMYHYVVIGTAVSEEG